MFMGMPLLFLFFGVLGGGCMRWFMFFFLMPFLFAGGTVMWSPYGGFVGLVLYVVFFVWLIRQVERSPKLKEIHEAMKKAKKTGSAVPVSIGGMTFRVGGGGGSSGGGGGFSGGGGSFGGGGASGGW
jgi:uncharacterized membrane protein YgcG